MPSARLLSEVVSTWELVREPQCLVAELPGKFRMNDLANPILALDTLHHGRTLIIALRREASTLVTMAQTLVIQQHGTFVGYVVSKC